MNELMWGSQRTYEKRLLDLETSVNEIRDMMNNRLKRRSPDNEDGGEGARWSKEHRGKFIGLKRTSDNSVLFDTLKGFLVGDNNLSDCNIITSSTSLSTKQLNRPFLSSLYMDCYEQFNGNETELVWVIQCPRKFWFVGNYSLLPERERNILLQSK